MKHLIALLSFIFCAITTSQAQSVYDYVLNNATRVVNSPVSNFTQTQIAQFKRTALVYLKRKAYEETDTIPSLFLDTQAYYMSEFITLFFEHVSKSKRLTEDKLQERIMIFTDASISNPMFNDPDKETTLSFILNHGEITPFSLDTDWEKAYFAAKPQVDKKK